MEKPIITDTQKIELSVDWREAPARGGDFELTVAGVLALAFVLRAFAGWISLAQGSWFARQGLEMSFMADSLAHGHGLGSPFGVPTGPTAMFAPVYPLLVSLFFRVFGSYSVASAVGIIAVQIGFNLLAIALLMYFARWHFGEHVALIAGVIWTFSPPLWWMPTIFWDTTITVCFVVGLLLLGLWAARGPRPIRWLALGAYCGAMALFNPALVPTILCLLVGLTMVCWRTEGGRTASQVSIAAIAFLVVFSVWPIRNGVVMHAFVPLRTAPGLDLWMGNHPGSSGYIETAEFPIYNHAELLKYERQGEVAYTQGKSDQAKKYIAGHPGEFALLTLRRVMRFWLGSGSRDGSPLFVLHALVTSTFGLIGLWMLVRRHRRMLAMLFSIPLMVFPLPYYVTHAEFRFRLVIDPILILLSAYAMVQMTKERSLAKEA